MSDEASYQPISSPCIGVGSLNDAGFGAGCFRKPEEITYWRTYTDEERAQITEELNARALDNL